MIFLTRLDDIAEPTPIGGRRVDRRVPTISEACGFVGRDYVPDPMAAPLGPFHYHLPDAPEATATVGPVPGRWPEVWARHQGALAMAALFVCDVVAPCDRLPGVTQPEAPDAPPLRRAEATARLGNLRDGRPRLAALFGGACLQGSAATAAQRALIDRAAPRQLRPDARADHRLGAAPALDVVRRRLIALHNALADDPAIADPRAAVTGLWHQSLCRDVVPTLCGPVPEAPPPAAPTGDRRSLALEVVHGPFAALAPMLLASTAPAAAAEALGRLVRRARRYALAPPSALLEAYGLPPSPGSEAPSLPAYLLEEAALARRPFGPLGGALFAEAALGLIAAEPGLPRPALSGPAETALQALRSLAQPA